MTEDLKKEIIDLLDNVTYWETCPESYKNRIEAVKQALTIPLVIRCDDAEYFELIEEKHKIGEENLDMIVREFNRLPRIVEINKRIKELNISCL